MPALVHLATIGTGSAGQPQAAAIADLTYAQTACIAGPDAAVAGKLMVPVFASGDEMIAADVIPAMAQAALSRLRAENSRRRQTRIAQKFRRLAEGIV